MGGGTRLCAGASRKCLILWDLECGKNAGDGRGPIYIDGQRVAWPLPTENRGHRRWKTLIGLLLEVSYAARPLAA